MPSNKSECHDLETRDRTKVHGYEEWIRSIKERIQRARVKASMLVNSEQTLLYWDIGHDILEKQESEGWGAKVVERMSADLKAAFPDMTGLSPRNLKYMRARGEYDLGLLPANAKTKENKLRAMLVDGRRPDAGLLLLRQHQQRRGDGELEAAL